MNIVVTDIMYVFEVYLTCWKKGQHNVTVTVVASIQAAAENEALDTAYPGSETTFRQLGAKVRQVRCTGLLDRPIVIHLEVV